MKKRMNNDKGLSTIVATLLILLLIFVAVGIVWAVVRNVVQQGSDQIEIGSKCFSTGVNVDNAKCSETSNGGNNGICNVTVSRNAESDEIGGIKLIFTSEDSESNYILDVPGDISSLATKKITNAETELINVSSVDVVVYFINSFGEEELCDSTESYQIN